MLQLQPNGQPDYQPEFLSVGRAHHVADSAAHAGTVQQPDRGAFYESHDCAIGVTNPVTNYIPDTGPSKPNFVLVFAAPALNAMG